ncbi:Conserved hypothetical protein [Parafrankia sp. Ea1.12]|uniref:hypothetical protein n=1 Tax=Parafrankia sp. Ea1.12 TaxID=573499 RepID=UPI000DA45099|nr:hypothetical protein [Parafrankia sp. Ea1.12]SQE00777.1 Conserved hypothetical protein [Parafrankia sp. Ea1.12]
MDEIETVDVTVLEAGRTSLLHARVEPGGPGRSGRVLVRPAEGGGLLGWRLRPQGWCRGDVCIPASVAARRLGAGERGLGAEDWIDVAEFAGLTGRLAMVDAARGGGRARPGGGQPRAARPARRRSPRRRCRA